MVRVKICGITSALDARNAVESGADALGFMFYSKSPRFIKPELAASIIRDLPPFVSAVGVFVDELSEAIEEIARVCRLDTLQFHGEERPEQVKDFQGRYRTCKAFRVRGPATLDLLPLYQGSAWLLDAFVDGQLGGTGARFDWGIAKEAVASGNPIILAGGLNCGNIQEAVGQVRPYAVDVSSGVEMAKGKKDSALVAEFIKRAKNIGH